MLYVLLRENLKHLYSHLLTELKHAKMLLKRHHPRVYLCCVTVFLNLIPNRIKKEKNLILLIKIAFIKNKINYQD